MTFNRLVFIVAIAAVPLAQSASAAVIPLSSPASFSPGATTIDFDDAVAPALANTRYAGQGVTFTRDDAQGLVISNWDGLGRTTTSSPNVIGSILDFDLGISSFVFHINVDFSIPVFEVGAFFGNDQGFGGYTQTTLTLFDAANAVIGSLVVPTNDNTNVDQFIGLKSDVAIARARFDNNGNLLAVGLDDLTFGGAAVPVPAPGTLLLLAGGLAGLFGTRRWTMARAGRN